MTVNDHSFTNWKNREEIAESMIPIIGKLHRERDVTVLLHSRSLVNKSVVSILKTHRFARQIAGGDLPRKGPHLVSTGIVRAEPLYGEPMAEHAVVEQAQQDAATHRQPEVR